MDTKDVYSLVCKHVTEFQTRHPYLVRDNIGLRELTLVSKELGIPIKDITDTPIEGRLETTPEGSVIFINSELELAQRVMIFAHELGHYVLRKYYPDIEKELALQFKELYANQFAYEVCFPKRQREIALEDIYNTEDITILPNLANKYSMSINYLLSKLKQEQRRLNFKRQRDYHNIWIIARHSENAYTKLEPKLRIITTFFDSDVFFIPQNQGVEKTILNSEWLKNLNYLNVQSCFSQVNIFVRNQNETPKFSKQVYPATCFALKMYENKKYQESQIILLLKLKSSI